MSLAALAIISLLHVLRVQSIDSSDAWSASSLSGFEFPEIDGSAVDNTCRIYIITDATTTSTTTTATTTTTSSTTTSPITRKVVETTTKSVVQSPPKKPEPKDNGAPIRMQPAAGGPNIDHRVVSLLYRLLANSRGHGAGVQPIGRQPRGGQAASSDSDESVAAWKTGSVSSDSSDES
ncbi:myb-like protein X isoform X2 [Amphiprion ocellaris]|uniref:myb-like protein X isoform X2 n=1 Tax=Amphiprion ocellaris TaxID=80972 RepID=UPI002410EFE6|nr:myb-like protein X isoform X2 [Amphiprion ocellaris]